MLNVAVSMLLKHGVAELDARGDSSKECSTPSLISSGLRKYPIAFQPSSSLPFGVNIGSTK